MNGNFQDDEQNFVADKDAKFMTTDQIFSVNTEVMIRLAARSLAEQNIEEPLREARFLLELATGISLSEQLAKPEQILTPQQLARFTAVLEKRLRNIPFAYISGEADFYGRNFYVEHCLIPRPETELIIDALLKFRFQEPLNILDLCTGTGCLGITLFLELEKSYQQINLICTDISQAALETCQKNFRRFALTKERAKAILADLFPKTEPERNLRYEIIVANPPYINSADIPGLQKEVQGFEPHTALDGGEDGLLFYRRIAEEIKPFLQADQRSFLFLEHGKGQRSDIKKIFRGADLKIEEILEIDDLQGIDRCLGFKLLG